MTSLLTSCYIRHVCWHYKSVCSLLINFLRKISYDDKLRKGPMSTKLTRPHSTHLTTMLVCDASSISQTSVKAKDHPRATKCIAADLWWLATDNDQQSYRCLSQTATLPEICNGLLFRSILRMCVEKSEVRSFTRSWDNRGYWKKWQSLDTPTLHFLPNF